MKTSPSIEKEHRNTYKLLSKFYDLFDLIFLLDGQGNPRQSLLTVIPNSSLRVLDVCVGTASSALTVAGQNTRNQIVGIDISDEMLAVGRKKISERGLYHVNLQHMPADEMTFAEGSFDAVMVSFALHEFAPELLDAVLRQVSRVLKCGGVFCLLDFARQASWRNRLFIKVWGLLEPVSFHSFLEIDWRTRGLEYDLHLQQIKQSSFSNLYVLCKN